jgi:hypothetical protein
VFLLAMGEDMAVLVVVVGVKEVIGGCWDLVNRGVSLYLWSSSWSGSCHEVFEKLQSMEVLVIHPSVIHVGITYPMHQVLELLPSAKTPHVQDSFDFVFFFAFFDIQWRPRVWGSVGLRLLIRG